MTSVGGLVDFWRFIAKANTPDSLASATAYLIDALTYTTDAQEQMCNYDIAFNEEEESKEDVLHFMSNSQL